MSNAVDADVIVVGAGISGLSAAWHMQQRGADVLLLESNDRTGGCISTIRSNGYLYEAGPNSALDTSSLIQPLLEELGIAAERIDANPAARNRFVVRDGRPLALPMSPLSFLTSPLFSFNAKTRLLVEPFVSRGSADLEESVAEFVERRIGREFLDYAINPFVGGVYAGRPEQLSVRAAFPRLHELERRYGSLIRGQIFGARERAREKQKSKHNAAMFSFRGGMSTLTDAIHGNLRRVELGTTVTAILKNSRHYALEATNGTAARVFRTRYIVIATPAHAAAHLIDEMDGDAATALRAIPYAKVTVVYCGFRRDTVRHPLDGFGMLVPECEGRQILGTIFSSSLFESRADHEHVLLTTFVGGMRQPGIAAIDDASLKKIVLQELHTLLGTPLQPEFFEMTRWERAIPQYTTGHAERIEKISRFERAYPGLHMCANYRGGISVGDCINAGQSTGAEVAMQLKLSN